ncbi:MAG: 2-amino-4-hydroxy-6-hydroxymethyldihydropteridine diphosphokinase [Lachnospiraceae bacterium]|nr:2-amino-4-hydroxy-6-hydroxymethyldihydropteridine diphosphokinase [Lachnospiraceae bacterium]
MDYVSVKRLEVFGSHGVSREENSLGQKFVVSVDMEVNTRRAGLSDALEDAVNYADVAELICRETKDHTFQLIERLAEHLASRILLSFPLVLGVSVEVEKPWAPIHIPLDTVSVKIYRKWHEVCLGLGSNMGDRRANMNRALELLSADKNNEVVKVSDYIETKPIGDVEQDDFLNGAILMRTLKSPEELLEQIGEIESDLKRVRTVRWGPRTIDVDILLYDAEIMETENLVIPHPEMCRRMFVLEPLNQIAPYRLHPVCKKTVREIYEKNKK